MVTSRKETMNIPPKAILTQEGLRVEMKLYRSKGFYAVKIRLVLT